MDNLSNELHKLKIDKSKRSDNVPVSGGVAWKYVAIFVILVGLGVLAFQFYQRANAAVAVDTVQPRVESSSSSAVLVATGYVVAHHKIQVGSKIMGRVSWIGVEKGDHVKKDQVVARLEDREYRAQFEQAQASYESAQARLNELQRGSRPEEIERAKQDVERADAQLRTDEAQLRRIENLVKEGVASPQSLDDARGRFETSRANLASLTQTYDLTRKGPRQEQIDNAKAEADRAKAAVEYAKSILDATEIRVPISGTILERNVEQGEMVTTSFVGQTGAKGFVVTLADLNDIQVELDINQNDFNRIGPSQPCVAVTDAFPDRNYKCRVDEIAPEANRQKATVQVKVKLLEPDDFVKPEMNARVTFMSTAASPEKTQETRLIIVPKRAIVERQSGTAVLVIADGKVQSKPVTVEKEIGTDVFVSQGLTGSESIIVGSQLAQLKVGDRVEARQ
jgi:HlyD family secretion protein